MKTEKAAEIEKVASGKGEKSEGGNGGRAQQCGRMSVNQVEAKPRSGPYARCGSLKVGTQRGVNE